MNVGNPDAAAGMQGDVAALLERVRRQQEEVEQIRRAVETMEVTGGSRRGEVRVTVRGSGQLSKVTIEPGALSDYDAGQLGEIVKEAVNDGLSKAAEASSARFRPIIEAASQTGQERG